LTVLRALLSARAIGGTCMYTGTLIQDLLSTVEKAEQAVARRLKSALSPFVGDAISQEAELEPKQFTQSLRLSAADRNLGLSLIIHPELVGTLEPRDDFADAIDVDDVRAMSSPKKIRV
jgi:hypothetical protein